MTRRSKRELERSVESLNDARDDDEDELAVVYEHPATGVHYKTQALEERADPDAEKLVVIQDTVVMERERAERGGFEILGPHEDPDRPELAGEDLVEVDYRSGDEW